MAMTEQALRKRAEAYNRFQEHVRAELSANAFELFTRTMPDPKDLSVSKREFEKYATMWRQLVSNKDKVVFIKHSSFIFK